MSQKLVDPIRCSVRYLVNYFLFTFAINNNVVVNAANNYIFIY